MSSGKSNSYSDAVKVTVLISLIAALILPVGYFTVSCRHMLGFMEASADINAGLLSRLITANPQLWRFETVRIEELLTRSQHMGFSETKRVYALDNTLVAEVNAGQEWPCISAVETLVDGDNKVGRLEVVRSIRPLLATTAVLALFGMIIGFLMYRWLPYTELIRVSRKLQESNLFLMELQRIARVGGWKASVKTDYLMWTDGVYDICEIPKDEPPPGLQDGFKYYLPEYIPVLAERIQKCIDTGEPFSEVCRIRTTSGRILWTEVRGLAPVKHGSDPVVIGTFQDINCRMMIEEELKKKNKDLEQFIYTVSHDLRSPLVTFKTFLGYLEDDLATGNRERMSQDLKFIHSAADRMKLLLDDLLEIFRIDHGTLPQTQFALRDILADVMDALAGELLQRKLNVCLPERDVILAGDRSRIFQIWQNLVENAIKYCKPERAPRIELGVRQSGDDTVFYVRDNGIGINPEYLDRIFNIFEKLDPKSDGAGMGLSMVRRIVERYNGRIWAESVEGEGACFNFTLPAALISGDNSAAVDHAEL